MEDEKVDSTYVRRFNDGYIIAKNMPELSEQLSKVQGGSLSFKAMQKGREQFLSEQTQEKLPQWLKKDIYSTKTISKEKNKDKSNEPDR